MSSVIYLYYRTLHSTPLHSLIIKHQCIVHSHFSHHAVGLDWATFDLILEVTPELVAGDDNLLRVVFVFYPSSHSANHGKR